MADQESSCGPTLRKWRERAGLSQRQLAELSGVHQGYISQLETDVYSPSVTTLSRLANAYGITVSDVLRDPDLPSPCTEGHV